MESTHCMQAIAGPGTPAPIMQHMPSHLSHPLHIRITLRLHSIGFLLHAAKQPVMRHHCGMRNAPLGDAC